MLYRTIVVPYDNSDSAIAAGSSVSNHVLRSAPMPVMIVKQ